MESGYTPSLLVDCGEDAPLAVLVFGLAAGPGLFALGIELIHLVFAVV